MESGPDREVGPIRAGAVPAPLRASRAAAAAGHVRRPGPQARGPCGAEHRGGGRPQMPLPILSSSNNPLFLSPSPKPSILHLLAFRQYY